MEIKILELLQGAKSARGLAVIIDVFRAFTLTCYMVERGAEKIICVDSPKLAFRMREDTPDCILIGEVKEKIVPGFDFGNSPTEIMDSNFRGKTIIHSTSAGTKGLNAAVNADAIITGSFVNAGAIVEYIQHFNPNHVSLVAMGYRAVQSSLEDIYCAQYIKNELDKEQNNFKKMKEKLKYGPGKRFFNPENINHSPPSDFYKCVELNKFSFVLKAQQEKDYVQLTPVKIQL